MSALRRRDLDPDPVRRVRAWYDAAASAELAAVVNAMALATATPDAQAAVRMVLLRGFDAEGVRFYTGYGSRKAGELDANPGRRWCFTGRSWAGRWGSRAASPELRRRYSDTSLRQPPRREPAGAPWASEQAAVLPSRDALERESSTPCASGFQTGWCRARSGGAATSSRPPAMSSGRAVMLGCTTASAIAANTGPGSSSASLPEHLTHAPRRGPQHAGRPGSRRARRRAGAGGGRSALSARGR